MEHNSWAHRVEQVWEAVSALRHRYGVHSPTIVTVTRDPSTYVPVIRQQVSLLVRASWEHGWLPYDTMRHLSRQFEDPVVAAVGAVVGEEADRIMATAPTHPLWRGSAADAHLLTAALGPQPRPGVLPWLEVLSVLRVLPPIAVLVPAPGSPAPRHLRTVRRPTASDVDQRQLERVRALLAKAESTTFADEAEAFTAKAQELIARHSLDHALASAGSGSSGPEPATIRVWFDDPYTDAKSVLLSQVARANRCQSVFDPGLGCSTVFGFDHDLDAVELLFTSLLAQATGAMTRHGSVRDADGRIRTKSFRRSFLSGFAYRIGERLRSVAEGQERDAVAESGGALVPVLAARHEQVEAVQREVFPKLTYRSTSITNGAGWTAGKIAADLAHLGPDVGVLKTG